MNMKDALVKQDMIKSASLATSSSLGSRASGPPRARNASMRSGVQLLSSSSRLAALNAGGTPAVPVKRLIDYFGSLDQNRFR